MNAERILKAVIKCAAVCLTAPATLAVASTLYLDFGLWRWVTAGAALVLVEGALLLGWQLLDSQGKTATSGQRSLYAALVVVAYVVLWAVALAHGEGLAGIAFRATLGVLIVYSLAEAGILAGLRQDNAVRRDVANDRKVRQYQRRLAVNDAISDLDIEFAIKDKERSYAMAEAMLRADNEHKQAMQVIGQGIASIHRIPKAVKRTRKERAIDKVTAARAANPGITHQELAELAGVSRQTVGAWLAELPAGNGNGHSHD